MKLPIQSKPVMRQAYASNIAADQNGLEAQSVCTVACDTAKALCYASPVPNFACDLAYKACMALC
ncbi:hypothetical protein [Aliikangiella sp. IMCC44359]|uniref:hypothetical protein n=1 Tax=Aliikangiella sp. IMCC44359 TaxID=3459125 RepID=UPI00403AA734